MMFDHENREYNKEEYQKKKKEYLTILEDNKNTTILT